MLSGPIILFAGGGTGGHIFPNIAVAERLSEQGIDSSQHHFLVSKRPLDAAILQEHGLNHTALHIEPPPRRLSAVWQRPGFVGAWFSSVGEARRCIEQTDAAVVVVTGGFVSAPVVVAARRAGVPVVLMNLDAPAGLANRLMARRATAVFSVSNSLNGQHIDVPLRRSAVGTEDTKVSRTRLGLDPDRLTLLVTGGSQGAETINQTMVELVAMDRVRTVFEGWQVLHLTGIAREEGVSDAYERAGVSTRAMPFCDRMGLAWSACDLAISRAGAGSVAEVWANATPTIFMPYPFHRDQHQKRNAARLEKLGGAVVIDDRVDPKLNASLLADKLVALMGDADRLEAMTRAMRENPPTDGAGIVAAWLIERCGAQTR